MAESLVGSCQAGRDVRMPLVDGVQATRELRRRDGGPPVLALTTFDDEVLAGVLRAGAAGFVLKGVPPRTCTGRCAWSLAPVPCSTRP